ncbi:MAG: hypothetical protein EBS53_14160 [Bacteroidetes bacterium]|nr:hypothetical protein [Bacteroidota bacterium]
MELPSTTNEPKEIETAVLAKELYITSASTLDWNPGLFGVEIAEGLDAGAKYKEKRTSRGPGSPGRPEKVDLTASSGIKP